MIPVEGRGARLFGSGDSALVVLTSFLSRFDWLWAEADEGDAGPEQRPSLSLAARPSRALRLHSAVLICVCVLPCCSALRLRPLKLFALLLLLEYSISTRPSVSIYI